MRRARSRCAEYGTTNASVRHNPSRTTQTRTRVVIRRHEQSPDRLRTRARAFVEVAAGGVVPRGLLPRPARGDYKESVTVKADLKGTSLPLSLRGRRRGDLGASMEESHSEAASIRRLFAPFQSEVQAACEKVHAWARACLNAGCHRTL